MFSRSTPRRGHIEPDPLRVLPPVLAQRAICAPRNVDGGSSLSSKTSPTFPTRSRIEPRAVSRCPTRINVLALRGGGGRRAGCLCVGSPPHPPGQAHYRPIFMAAITRQSSAGGLCSPASEWVGCSRLRCYRSHLMGQSTQRPLVYTAVGPGVLATAKPAIKEVAQVPRIPEQAADDSTTARVAEPAPTRGKTFSNHASKHRASGHRYAARKSHRREVLGYARYGAYPRAHYGFNGSRYGGWSFN